MQYTSMHTIPHAVHLYAHYTACSSPPCALHRMQYTSMRTIYRMACNAPALYPKGKLHTDKRIFVSAYICINTYEYIIG